MSAATYEQFLTSKLLVVPNAGKDVPEERINPHLFPFQRDLVKWSLKKGRAAIFSTTGTGKALASDTGVVTPTGLRRIDSLQPGDQVIGADGMPTTVLGVFPQGKRVGYRMTFSDKNSVVCDAEHLWTVRTKGDKYRGRCWRTLTLAEMMEIGIGGAGKDRYGRWFVPMVEPVRFQEMDLPLHPYVLGCLLGDGCLTHGTPMLTTADKEMVDRFNTYLPIGMELVKKRYSLYDWMVLRSGIDARNAHEKNQVREALETLGLWGHRAERKFIPDCYKIAAIDTRLWLIQSLLDTDGCIWMSKNSSMIEFSSASERLAQDFLFLVQSIGGKGCVNRSKTQGLDRFRVNPSFPTGSQPFLLSRKADLYRDRIQYMPAKSVRQVEEIGLVDMTCIAVDAPDGLFVVENFIVTHNTRIQLAWAEHAAKRVLALAPLAVAKQTVREGEKMGISVTYARGQHQAAPEGITIANYEMLAHFDPDQFGAVICDESGILKSFEGKTKAALIAAFLRTPMRLCCTATPAPNEIAEIANHAEFLGLMTRAEMLAAFFLHDDAGWRLKRHARQPFYRWLASWGMSLNKPSDIGHDDTGYDLPPLAIDPIFVDTDYTPAGKLFALDLKGVTERASVRRGTLAARVAAALAQIREEPEEPWLCWYGLLDEGRELKKALGQEAVFVEGSLSPEEKEARLLKFLDGEARILISHPLIAGFGLNLQHCARMLFVGLGDSYEQYFQCIRRCWRFGQEREVKVSIILSEPERVIYENVLRKEREAQVLAAELVAHVKEFEREEILAINPKQSYRPEQKMELPSWLS